MHHPRHTIVYADDDPDAVFFVQRAFKALSASHHLEIAQDGEQAITRIREKLPHMVLLDLKMPFFNGIEVVAWMRCQPAPVSGIPAVLFSSSALQSDILLARSTGANGYIVKPAKLDDLRDVLQALSRSFLSDQPVPDWHEFHGHGMSGMGAA
ncbi:MAG: response regulator [Verrucomicrobia bacterium]|nr:response regulator [Verrucomicrobiota bacterium]